MKGTRMLYTQAEFDALIQSANSSTTSSGYDGIIARANSLVSNANLAKVNFIDSVYNPTDQNYQQTDNLSEDTQNIFLLGIAYKLTNNATYALKSQLLIENIMKKMTGVYKNSANQYNMQGANTLPFFIPCMIFGADLVKTTFNDTNFKIWLTSVVSVCSAKILDTYSPNNNNINIAWNTLDLAIAIYKGDETGSNGINVCRDYWKTLINTQIASNVIPPLKENDTDTTPIPFTILPQEIDRSDKYSIGTTSYFHSGDSQGVRGIHYTNFALMNFILTARLLANQKIDVIKASTTPVLTHTQEGQKLQSAMVTNALFITHPESFPYYWRLLSKGYTDFDSPNETSYMRLAVKVFGGEPHEFINTILTAKQQTYDRYLFIPILSKRWIPIPQQ
jgi:hypothetical protein